MVRSPYSALVISSWHQIKMGMNMKNLLLCLIAIMAIGTNVAVSDTLINLEEAAEVENLKIRLNGSVGNIYARICDECEMLTLRANNDTRIQRGRSIIDLQQAAELKNKGATVLFNPSTLRVTRIIFWN